MGILRKQGGSPTTLKLNWINDALDADPGFLCLHHKTMQSKWHQYIECTSMRGEY
uniref:Late blight resistance protein n=1 Tax=Solanum tuberosum TaxID=4113 RepID=M1ANQ8_SOLTU